jgi:hypothetical protein
MKEISMCYFPQKDQTEHQMFQWKIYHFEYLKEIRYLGIRKETCLDHEICQNKISWKWKKESILKVLEIHNIVFDESDKTRKNVRHKRINIKTGVEFTGIEESALKLWSRW